MATLNDIRPLSVASNKLEEQRTDHWQPHDQEKSVRIDSFMPVARTSTVTITGIIVRVSFLV